jgi:hypothetical protein
MELITAKIKKPPGSNKFVANPKPICMNPDNQKRILENFIEMNSEISDTGKP